MSRSPGPTPTSSRSWSAVTHVARAVAHHDLAALAAAARQPRRDRPFPLLQPRLDPGALALDLGADRLLAVRGGGLVLLGQEAQRHPAENVVHDRLGERDLGVAGEAGGLEAGVGELVHEEAQLDAVLQRERDRGCERVGEAGQGRSGLAERDEDLAGLAVLVE